MIAQHPYTTAADIWSAGVLLFMMVTGHLPWDDPDVVKLAEKIVYTDTAFPPFLSGALVDLLKKIFVKNPDQRITLANIKGHVWFAQSRYMSGLGEQIKGLQAAGQTVDREVINRLAGLGVDCSALDQQVVGGQHTEVTAMYRMLLRDRLTEAMTDHVDPATAPAMPLPTRIPRQTASGVDRFAPRAGAVLRLNPLARALSQSSTPPSDTGGGMWRRQRGLASRPGIACRSPGAVQEDRAQLV
jgi:hypothetical protein